MYGMFTGLPCRSYQADYDNCIVNRDEVQCNNCERHCPTGAITWMLFNNVFKVLGAGATVTGAALVGCKPNNTVSAEGGSIGEVPTDKMTYRINHNTGDKVFLLG
jgi:ferredoxin